MRSIKHQALLVGATAVLFLSGCGEGEAPYYDQEMADDYYEETETSYWNGESYARIVENKFHSAIEQSISTFSIDVDVASYANVRRFLQEGVRPPAEAVRIEELVNYFTYDYPQPTDGRPFAVQTEVSECPWNDKHRLIHIGLQGRIMNQNELPPSNLVFLIDVSGSMGDANKLPLLKDAFRLLVEQLGEEDHVSIVTYAGAAGIALEPTPGSDKRSILKALEELQSGGSTAGAEGIETAYELAEDAFLKEGNNRVILATDGDFNVGVSSEQELIELIEEKRETGIYLSVLGFGTGNYQDAKMEQLADHGNGNYAYIDNYLEARRVLSEQVSGTLHTIAQDVKIQVEFNPAKVKSYRLIGYENRMMKNEDFKNDKKDAGELGAGHTVTALYEIVPYGVEETEGEPATNRYLDREFTAKAGGPEVCTVKLRYKQPGEAESTEMEIPAIDRGTRLNASSDNFRFSASVAGFGLLLRDSQFKGEADWNLIEELAEESVGKDINGDRKEFLDLIEIAKDMFETSVF